MFGSTPVASTAQGSGGLFSFNNNNNNNTSQPQQGGSLFGNSAKPAGGLLGGGAPASTQPAAGGIFGNLGAASSQPAGGLFGQSASTAPAAGNLFGASQPASQPTQAAGNLFGASQPAATTQQQRPSLFQAAQSAARPPPLFGASAGAGNANQQNSNAQQQQQQTVPGIKIDVSNIKPTTRMFELHEDIQNTILQIDEVINGGINASMQCAQVLPKLGEAIEQLPLDVAYLESQIEIVEGALGRDAVDVGAARQVVRADASDATVVFGAIENLKLPSQFHYGGGGVSGSGGANLQTTSSNENSNASSTDLLAYFNTQSNTLDQRLAAFTRQLLEVELHLRTVEATAVDGIEKLIRRRSIADAGDDAAGGNGGGAGDAGEGIRELVGTMRRFEDAVLRVAGRVGGVREGVVDLGVGLRD
jgi:nucleoporin p58/p45